jgi:hypothetical protein
MSKKAVIILLTVTVMAFGFVSNAMAIDGLARAFQVVVNPGGLGDSLIYPYYNVRGNINAFNIINTDTSDGAKVRVVFRAGKNSEEVLDFSVCLSRTDVWTAYLIDSGNTAAICPFDTDTVTAPDIPAGCQAFKIPTGSSLTNDDLREGYFEVLGLSTLPGYDKNINTGVVFATNGNYIKTAADCANYHSAAILEPLAGPVPNVLFGNNTIVNLTSLGTYSQNAAALGFSSESAVPDPGPGSELTIAQLGIAGCPDLEIALAKTNLISPYDIVTDLGGETSLIVTFPSRRACHLQDPVVAPVPPFAGTDPFNCTFNLPSGECTTYATPVDTVVYDDKENAQNILDFSPAGASALPYEVNVINLGTSSVWNSTLAQSFTVSIGDGLGWVNLGFTSVDAPFGLPVLGYTTQNFLADAATYMTPMAYQDGIAPLIP